jgi:hypothetical protein
MDRHGITDDILGSALVPLVVEAREFFKPKLQTRFPK